MGYHSLRVDVHLGLAAIGLLSSTTLQSQSLPSGGLLIAEELSQPVGVVELGGGGVLVADRIERTVYLLDPGTRTRRSLATDGRGPREVAAPASLWRLPDGGAAVVDFGNARVMYVGRGGAVDSTVSYAGRVALPQAVDGQNNLVAVQVLRPGEAGFGASRIPLLRLAPGARIGSVIDTLHLPNPVTPNQRRRAFEPADAWTLFPDGAIAIVRAQPFRVDWMFADGRRSQGRTITHSAVPITAADREAWIGRESAPEVVYNASGARRELPRQPVDPRTVDFPTSLPPFEDRHALPGPNGQVWIRLSANADAATHDYIAVDRTGEVVLRLRVPAGRRLASISERFFYVYDTDADEMVTITRIPRG